jgi:hypothetical protein
MQESMILDEVEIVDRTQQEIAAAVALLAEHDREADPGGLQIRAAAAIARARIREVSVADLLNLEALEERADAWLASLATEDAPAPVAEESATPTTAPVTDKRIIRAMADAKVLRAEIASRTAKLKRLEDAIQAAASPK